MSKKCERCNNLKEQIENTSIRDFLHQYISDTHIVDTILNHFKEKHEIKDEEISEEQIKVENKFITVYGDWVKESYPDISDNLPEKIAKSYIEFFRYLSSLEVDNVLEIVDYLKNKPSFKITPMEETILLIDELAKKYGESTEPLIFLNAFILQKEMGYFQNLKFSEEYFPNTATLLPYSKDLHNILGLLIQFKSIGRRYNVNRWNYWATNRGLLHLKKNIMFYLYKDDVSGIIVNNFTTYEKNT